MSGRITFTEVENRLLEARRGFLKKLAFLFVALLAGGVTGYRFLRRLQERRFNGSIIGPSRSIGHLLRENSLTEPQSEISRETVIIGGGISGLSAAWWLNKQQYHDFLLLELESEVGGNSKSGRNEISAYPWAAHYLPLPGPEAKWVSQLLEELEVIQGYDRNGAPIYNEFYLCADPHERLLIQGRWQEGVVPQVGLTQADRRDYEGFFKQMEAYKNARGKDGKRAFTIPLELSSRDSEFLILDRISMAEFMRSKGWVSKKLHWYVSYCCRDDYGIGHEEVSAWAGIHYFASRVGRGANADPQTVLTWPEGNGWLANRLREKCLKEIQSDALVYSVRQDAQGVTVDYLDTRSRKSTRIHAKQVIFAAPRFVASHVLESMKSRRPGYFKDLRYVPWMVANVSMRSLPGGDGAPLSWDNVSFYSNSLGYIVATHQELSLFPKQTVLTYYLPLDEKDPVEVRKEALKKDHQDWARLVADDLERMHLGIKEEITNIDVYVWGHGMISPTIGFIWGESRQQMLHSDGRIHFAHTDMSGVSIFEEAQYRGVQAANQVLQSLGKSGSSRS